MAGDWIKMRTDLADDPAVIHIAEATGLDQDTVVGKLHRIWSWADRHTTDGVAQFLTATWIDRHACCDGFGAAMAETGWLSCDSDGIVFPNFDNHNGRSSKLRAEATNRVREHRKRSCNDSVTQTKRDKVTIPRPLRAAVHERDGNACVYCGRKQGDTLPTESATDGHLTLDHVYPESRGGDTTLDNLVTCCNCCNRFKAHRTPDECGLEWPVSVTGKRYGSVTKALPEKRREEKRREESALPQILNTETFQKTLADWKSYHKPYKPVAWAKMIARAANLAEAHGLPAVCAAMDRAMANGWTGWDQESSFQQRNGAPVVGHKPEYRQVELRVFNAHAKQGDFLIGPKRDSLTGYSRVFGQLKSKAKIESHTDPNWAPTT